MLLKNFNRTSICTTGSYALNFLVGFTGFSSGIEDQQSQLSDSDKEIIKKKIEILQKKLKDDKKKKKKSKIKKKEIKIDILQKNLEEEAHLDAIVIDNGDVKVKWKSLEKQKSKKVDSKKYDSKNLDSKNLDSSIKSLEKSSKKSKKSLKSKGTLELDALDSQVITLSVEQPSLESNVPIEEEDPQQETTNDKDDKKKEVKNKDAKKKKNKVSKEELTDDFNVIRLGQPYEFDTIESESAYLYGVVHNNIGAREILEGDTKSCQKNLTQAMKEFATMEPEHSYAQYNFALCLAKGGDYKKALAQLNEAKAVLNEQEVSYTQLEDFLSDRLRN